MKDEELYDRVAELAEAAGEPARQLLDEDLPQAIRDVLAARPATASMRIFHTRLYRFVLAVTGEQIEALHTEIERVTAELRQLAAELHDQIETTRSDHRKEDQ